MEAVWATLPPSPAAAEGSIYSRSQPLLPFLLVGTLKVGRVLKYVTFPPKSPSPRCRILHSGLRRFPVIEEMAGRWKH